jgi:putative hydroxymethylpyrimidine transport system substrate-binding protein
MTPLRSLPVALATLALALALAAAGCGEKSEPGPAAAGGGAKLEPFTLVLDYFPNADHAGIYEAQASGEYRRAGLDVKIQAPPDPSAPLKLLQAGRADAVISYEPELLLARQKTRDLVSVGALVQRPLTSLMAVGRAHVRSVRDLRGKRVGTSGIPYQSAYLKTILAKAGVPPGSVQETNVGFNLVPAMISGRVAATLGAFWNYEGVDLRQRGRDPVIFRMDQLGVPTYAELVFVARRQDLDEQGASRVRRFLQATARGHRRLREDPRAGVDALLRANPDLSRRLQEAAVRATLPVFFPRSADQPFGYQDPAAWQAYGDWMYRNRLLTQPPNAGRAMTNEFLAGQGLDPGTAGRD